MRPTLHFFVHGEPVAQPRPRARAVKMGPKWIATVYNPKDADAWKTLIKNEYAKHNGMGPIEGPVSVRFTFIMPRPKSHFLKAGLRPNAPKYCTTRPDGDNLAKAGLDALTDCGAWSDDAQVVALSVRKLYTPPLQTPGVLVEIKEAVDE